MKFTWRRQRERELDEEIRADLAMEVQQRIASGESAEAAKSAALREFGNATLVKEETREMWGWGPLERFVQDIGYAWRVLRKRPGFAAIVVLILALGIGTNTAVFTLVNSVVLKSLPVHKPEELVWFRDPSFSYPIFEQVRDRQDIFAGLFAWDVQDLHVEWNGDPSSTEILTVSSEFHSTLGVPAARGRTIDKHDEQVAVISHQCWLRRFNQDPEVLGRTIFIERVPFTVIGVMPPDFFGVAPGMSPEVTIPLTVLPRLRPENADILRRPSQAWLHLMARLKPGISLQQAESAVQVFWPHVMEATTDPTLPAARRARFLGRTTGLESGRTGFSRIRNRFAEPLWLLLGLVSLLLLVAGATVANLMLAQASARHRETAVRIALGATRTRIVRQFITEGFLLAGAGAALGLVLGVWGSHLIVKLLATSHDPIVINLAPDWNVLAFTVMAALASVIMFALAPALRSTRIDPGPALQETERTAGSSVRGAWLGKSLVISQVAFSMLLLVGATLFVRSLLLLLSADPGFRSANVLLIHPDPIAAKYQGPRLVRFYDELLKRLRAMPGVQSASLSWVPPVSNEMGAWTETISVDGSAPQQDERFTYFNAVSPGYFETLGTPLLRGRDFGPRDSESAPRTVIVNDSLVRAYFPGQDPIGRRISIGRNATRQDMEIVGVVKNAKYQRLQEPSRRIAYFPYPQFEFAGGSNLIAAVRTSVPPGAVIEAIRRDVRAMDAGVPVRFETLEERIRESLVKEQVLATISGFLGLTSLLLACAGLYGLMRYLVTRRTKEIGIRIALGARQSAVLRMILRESLALAGLGVLAGLIGSVAAGRFVASLLYGLKTTDVIALTAATLIMGGVTMIASWLPARRAARVDPVIALRTE